MKSLLLLAALLISLQGYSQINSQDSRGEKINLHLQQKAYEESTGKAFLITGFAISAASPIFMIGRAEYKQEYASAICLVGGAFSTYGFFHILNSGRHLKKIRAIASN